MADINEKIKEITDTRDSTAEFEPADIEKNKGMSILAYISWLVLIPLFCAKDSKFARFHVNQGLVLAIVETVGSIVFFRVLAKLPLIGWLFGIVGGLFDLAVFILFIIGIVNVMNGKAKELPIIGRISLIK